MMFICSTLRQNPLFVLRLSEHFQFYCLSLCFRFAKSKQSILCHCTRLFFEKKIFCKIFVYSNRFCVPNFSIGKSQIMADLSENMPDPPEALNASTENHMSDDAENKAEPTESSSATAGASEHDTDDTNANANVEQTDGNVPEETDEISVEAPPIDESLIGHVTISKECEDFSKKLFTSSLENNERPTVGRRSRRQSLAYEMVKEAYKRDRLSALANRFDSFVGKTSQKIEQIDTQIATMEKQKN